LKNGFIWWIEIVDNARAQFVKPPGKAGMDRGKIVNTDPNEQSNRQDPYTSKFLNHEWDYKAKKTTQAVAFVFSSFILTSVNRGITGKSPKKG
jgi:hypothetical protein